MRVSKVTDSVERGLTDNAVYNYDGSYDKCNGLLGVSKTIRLRSAYECRGEGRGGFANGMQSSGAAGMAPVVLLICPDRIVSSSRRRGIHLHTDTTPNTTTLE